MSRDALTLVVLAAGAARRFGSDKLLAPADGRPLLAATLGRAASSIDPERTIVAIGPDQRRRGVVAKVAGAEVLVVPDAGRGMRWTLHAALAAVPADASGALVALADDPLALDALDGVVTAARSAPDRVVAVRRSPFLPHPVYLPRSAFPPEPVGEDDEGLRALVDAPGTAWVEDHGPRPVDVDEPADLALVRLALRRTAPARGVEP